MKTVFQWLNSHAIDTVISSIQIVMFYKACHSDYIRGRLAFLSCYIGGSYLYFLCKLYKVFDFIIDSVFKNLIKKRIWQIQYKKKTSLTCLWPMYILPCQNGVFPFQVKLFLLVVSHLFNLKELKPVNILKVLKFQNLLGIKNSSSRTSN